MHEHTMVKGNIAKQLIIFAIPLLLGNLFQQLYSTVDSVIIGNYVGDTALAAVNSSTPITFLFISFFSGLAVGSGVVIANFYGAKRFEEMSKCVHTAIAITCIGSVFLTILGFYLAPVTLHIMGVNSEVFTDSLTYLQIYFLGSFGVITFNMGAGILRAIGDSRSPLYILITATLINIILDLTFVIVFHMGVRGVAIATLIAQVSSALLVLLLLTRAKGKTYQLTIRNIAIDKESALHILRIGLPVAFQNTIISFSNAIVQSNVNAFGKYAMAGAGSYSRIDGFAVMPVFSFSNAITTFVAQNRGAKQYDRVKKGIRIGVLLSLSLAIPISILLLLFAPYALSLFSSNPNVIDYGTLMLRFIAPGYFILVFSHNLAGALQGAGKTKIAMYSMLFSLFVCRVAWTTITMHLFHDIRFVFIGWPITWSINAIILITYFRKANWLEETS